MGQWDSYGVETDSCFFQVKASIVPPTVIGLKPVDVICKILDNVYGLYYSLFLQRCYIGMLQR